MGLHLPFLSPLASALLFFTSPPPSHHLHHPQPFTIAISSSIDGTGAEVLSSRASPSITIAPSVSFASLRLGVSLLRQPATATPLDAAERLRSILCAAS